MAIDDIARSRIRLRCFLLGLFACQILLDQEIGSHSGSSVPEEVTAWFQSAAIPLESTSPQSGLKDLMPLLSAVGDARIVAMGEATHGTREFFQLKHRMLEFLVERMGFTVFGIEANWPESLAVNDYVLNGKGDPAQALAGLYFWTWNTEEVLDMIQWMRMYNQDPRHAQKVKFCGFDMQVSRVAVSNVELYLQKADAEEAKVASTILAPLSDAAAEREYPAKSAGFRHKTSEGIQSLLARFESRKKAYQDSSSIDEWESARHNLEIVQQAEEMHSAVPTGSSSVRDRSMAENVKWILDHEGPTSKIMLWAHNGHVSTLPVGAGETMGMSLRRMYGKKMVVGGFSFDHGSFQAIQQGKGLREFTVGPATPGSLDAALAATGIPIVAIDLRRAPSSGAVADWLNTPQLMRSIGAVYSENSPGAYFASANLHSFDLIFFVNHTTAAHEIPKHAEIDFRGRGTAANVPVSDLSESISVSEYPDNIGHI
jgi:erythromycin esterase